MHACMHACILRICLYLIWLRDDATSGLLGGHSGDSNLCGELLFGERTLLFFCYRHQFLLASSLLRARICTSSHSHSQVPFWSRGARTPTTEFISACSCVRCNQVSCGFGKVWSQKPGPPNGPFWTVLKGEKQNEPNVVAHRWVQKT